jgi:hypothetical protein
MYDSSINRNTVHEFSKPIWYLSNKNVNCEAQDKDETTITAMKQQYLTSLGNVTDKQ